MRLDLMQVWAVLHCCPWNHARNCTWLRQTIVFFFFFPSQRARLRGQWYQPMMDVDLEMKPIMPPDAVSQRPFPRPFSPIWFSKMPTHHWPNKRDREREKGMGFCFIFLENLRPKIRCFANVTPCAINLVSYVKQQWCCFLLFGFAHSWKNNCQEKGVCILSVHLQKEIINQLNSKILQEMLDWHCVWRFNWIVLIVYTNTKLRSWLCISL